MEALREQGCIKRPQQGAHQASMVDSAVERLIADVVGQLHLPAVAIGEKLLLVIQELLFLAGGQGGG